MNHPLSDMMTSTMAKIKDMIDVNTVIGDPITTPDGVTIIPVTKVSIGYGSGGSDFAMSSKQPDNCFGGGAGGGVLAGLWFQKVPAKWLHLALGALILLGGVRLLIC